MDMLTLIGLVAACCTTAAFIPQVVAILRTGNVDGISLQMYVIFTLGVALWFSYGIILGDLPIILANLITLALSASVLTLTISKRLQLRKLEDQLSAVAIHPQNMPVGIEPAQLEAILNGEQRCA